MKRPGKKSFVVLGVVVLLVIAGSTAQAGWLFVLAAGVAGLLGGSFLIPQRLASYEVKRSTPPLAIAGHEARVKLTVTNTGNRTLPLTRVEDRFPGLQPSAYVCERTPPGATSTASLTTIAPRRGVFEGGEVQLEAGSPFGFVRARRVVQVPSKMLVVPRWVELSSFPILEPASSPNDVLHERARTGAGEEYLGVRPYRPGDPQRFVHWRSSARAGSLVVREYQEHVQTKVALVLAGVDAGEPPDSAFEVLVSAAASIGNYALATGHPIEIVMNGSEGVRRLVRPSRDGMLRWLAEATPSAEPLGPLVAAATGGAGKRGTVVLLVTSSGGPAPEVPDAIAQIQTAGARAALVLADAPSWVGKKPDPAAPGVTRFRYERYRTRVLRKGEDLRTCLQR